MLSTAVFGAGLPVALAAADPPDGAPASSDITMRLERDGSLSVTERIVLPPGVPAHRTVPLRQPAGDDRERVFAIRNPHVDGNATARVSGQDFLVTANPGVSTLRYSVAGAVADLRNGQEVHWTVASGWDVPFGKVSVSSVTTPEMPTTIDCRAGAVGTTTRCDLFEIGPTRDVRAEAIGLAPGERMDLALTLPAGSVPANARFDETFSLTRAFAVTPASGAGLAGVGLLVIGGFGLLWYTRGRDVRALAGDVGPVDVLLTDTAGAVTFASPDGVLPGQVGTVVDENVDVVDVTATVVDLAVRNYLWIEELPGEQQAKDWRIVRLNPPDEALRPYERRVCELLLGTREEVLLSELRTGPALDLTGVRDALYAEVVEKNWFARRPDTERNLFWWIGAGVAIGGAALTVALALTTSLALVGIGVLLGGIALTLGARLMPARTRRGSALVAQMRGLREYLHGVSAESLSERDREMVFSRSMPYAIVLGEAERWSSEFADLDPGADGTPGLYWYGEYVEQSGHIVPNLRRFRTHFPLLLAALDAVLARAGHLRAMS